MEAVMEADQVPKYPTGSAYPIIRGIMFYNITNISRLR